MSRDFDEVINTIESAERDVDRILKAARLARHEKQRIDYEFLIIPMTMIFGFATLALLVIFG